MTFLKVAGHSGTDFWTLHFNPVLGRQRIAGNHSLDLMSYEVKLPESASSPVTSEVRALFPRLLYASWIKIIFGGGGDK